MPRRKVSVRRIRNGRIIRRGDTGSSTFVSSGHVYHVREPTTGRVVLSPRSAPGMRRRTVRVRGLPHSINAYQLTAERTDIERTIYGALKEYDWWQYRYYRPYRSIGVALRGHFTNADGERVALDKLNMSTFDFASAPSVEGAIRVALSENLSRIARSMREGGSIHNLHVEGVELTLFDLEEEAPSAGMMESALA